MKVVDQHAWDLQEAIGALHETRVPYSAWSLREVLGTDAALSNEDVALRIVIGHELFPDHGALGLPHPVRGILAFFNRNPNDELYGTAEEPPPSPGEAVLEPLVEGFRRVTAADVAAFRNAVDQIVAAGPNGRIDYVRVREALEPISSRIVEGDGNSAADLVNSAVNYALGQMIAANQFSDNRQVARWIRRNEMQSTAGGN